MGPMELVSGCPKHRQRQSFFVDVVPQTSPRDFIFNDGSRVGRTNTKTVAIEHFETLHLPAPPIFDIALKANGDVPNPKVEVCEMSQLIAMDISMFYENASFVARFFGDRIDFERVDDRVRNFRPTGSQKFSGRTESVFQMCHVSPCVFATRITKPELTAIGPRSDPCWKNHHARPGRQARHGAAT